MLIWRVTVHSVRKEMSNHLIPWSTKEVSLIVNRLLAWITTIEDITGLAAEDLTYIRQIMSLFY